MTHPVDRLPVPEDGRMKRPRGRRALLIVAAAAIVVSLFSYRRPSSPLVNRKRPDLARPSTVCLDTRGKRLTGAPCLSHPFSGGEAGDADPRLATNQDATSTRVPDRASEDEVVLDPDSELNNEELKRYAHLPDWEDTGGAHVFSDRHPIEALYSSDPGDRRNAAWILSDRLRHRFDQGTWNELLKALERWQWDERWDLLQEMLLTGREQATDLQVQEFSRPDPSRRFDGLDAALGALGGRSDHSSQMMGWLNACLRLQPAGTEPSQVALRYIERIEPLAQQIAGSDPDSDAQRTAGLLVQRCEVVRKLIAAGKRIPGMTYPDGFAIGETEKK